MSDAPALPPVHDLRRHEQRTCSICVRTAVGMQSCVCYICGGRKDTDAQVVVLSLSGVTVKPLTARWLPNGWLLDLFLWAIRRHVRRLVIMGYVEGRTLSCMEALPDDFIRRVRRALYILHRGGFVFGHLKGRT